MNEQWRQKLEQQAAQISPLLGDGNPIARCFARFNMAVVPAVNEWYADECQRGTNPAHVLQVATCCFGQILGTMLSNLKIAPETVELVRETFELEMRRRIAEAASGKFEHLKVPLREGR